ncbi:MAG: DUF3846 domain-containing protein [Erysipelotrichaceae bacterium]|nr:DUF3846 domain-containing protein [Erysipelotrichaceae bacterium]
MEREEKLSVILVKPGEIAEQVEIDDTLEAMQETVGGYIESYMPFEDEVAIVCNDEGKMNGEPLNRAIKDGNGEIIDIICGDFFICYAPIGSENFHSMPPDLMEKYEEKFRLPEEFFRAPDGKEIIAIPYEPGERMVIDLDER